MKAKKVLVTVLAAAALVTASVFGTMAYLTDKDSVTNTFTVGKVDITLDEAEVDIHGDAVTPAARVTSNKFHLIPGEDFTKDPTVTVKAGSEASYVRMFMTITNSKAWDEVCKQYTVDAGTATEHKLGITDMLKGYDADKWIYKGNVKDDTDKGTRTYEFWYNGTPAANNADKALEPLFKEIVVPGVFTNADLQKLDGFEIQLEAHAIQKSGFETAEKAWGEGWNDSIATEFGAGA